MPESRVLDPLPAGTQSSLRSGSESVVCYIPTVPSTDVISPLKTTISLPCYSDWTHGLYFHASHAEYLRLVKGAVLFELDGITKHTSAISGAKVDIQTG